MVRNMLSNDCKLINKEYIDSWASIIFSCLGYAYTVLACTTLTEIKHKKISLA